MQIKLKWTNTCVVQKHMRKWWKKKTEKRERRAQRGIVYSFNKRQLWIWHEDGKSHCYSSSRWQEAFALRDEIKINHTHFLMGGGFHFSFHTNVLFLCLFLCCVVFVIFVYYWLMLLASFSLLVFFFLFSFIRVYIIVCGTHRRQIKNSRLHMWRKIMIY